MQTDTIKETLANLLTALVEDIEYDNLGKIRGTDPQEEDEEDAEMSDKDIDDDIENEYDAATIEEHAEKFCAAVRKMLGPPLALGGAISWRRNTRNSSVEGRSSSSRRCSNCGPPSATSLVGEPFAAAAIRNGRPAFRSKQSGTKEGKSMVDAEAVGHMARHGASGPRRGEAIREAHGGGYVRGSGGSCGTSSTSSEFASVRSYTAIPATR